MAKRKRTEEGSGPSVLDGAREEMGRLVRTTRLLLLSRALGQERGSRGLLDGPSG